MLRCAGGPRARCLACLDGDRVGWSGTSSANRGDRTRRRCLGTAAALGLAPLFDISISWRHAAIAVLRPSVTVLAARGRHGAAGTFRRWWPCGPAAPAERAVSPRHPSAWRSPTLPVAPAGCSSACSRSLSGSAHSCFCSSSTSASPARSSAPCSAMLSPCGRARWTTSLRSRRWPWVRCAWQTCST